MCDSVGWGGCVTVWGVCVCVTVWGGGGDTVGW